jgi:hypothetical protein
MKTRAMAFLALMLIAIMIPAAGFAALPYSQDFEGLNAGNTSALADDGWLVFGNVFGLDWAYWYGYGVFPAPNDGGAFCAIVSGEGGAEQGMQQMSVFSDYNNTDHPNAWIQSIVFQEMPIGEGDVGETWVFTFDAKKGNIEGDTYAEAFIKTLDPNAGYATTNYIIQETTATSDTWTGYTLSLVIDGSLAGQLLQIGFLSNTTSYQGSGVFYDNINFMPSGSVATESTSLDGLKSMYR